LIEKARLEGVLEGWTWSNLRKFGTADTTLPGEKCFDKATMFETKYWGGAMLRGLEESSHQVGLSRSGGEGGDWVREKLLRMPKTKISQRWNHSVSTNSSRGRDPLRKNHDLHLMRAERKEKEKSSDLPEASASCSKIGTHRFHRRERRGYETNALGTIVLT